MLTDWPRLVKTLNNRRLRVKV